LADQPFSLSGERWWQRYAGSANNPEHGSDQTDTIG